MDELNTSTESIANEYKYGKRKRKRQPGSLEEAIASCFHKDPKVHLILNASHNNILIFYGTVWLFLYSLTTSWRAMFLTRRATLSGRPSCTSLPALRDPLRKIMQLSLRLWILTTSLPHMVLRATLCRSGLPPDSRSATCYGSSTNTVLLCFPVKLHQCACTSALKAVITTRCTCK